MRRIATEIIAEIKRLLRETSLSCRKIALTTGVSRATVSRVKAGKHRVRARRQTSPVARPHIVPRMPAAVGPALEGPVYRCPRCGVNAIILVDAGICWACCLRKNNRKATKPTDDSVKTNLTGSRQWAMYRKMQARAKKRHDAGDRSVRPTADMEALNDGKKRVVE